MSIHRGHHIRHDIPIKTEQPPFPSRYPYLTRLTAIILLILALAWLFTHEACRHPLGNLAAFAIMIATPILYCSTYPWWDMGDDTY